MKLLSALTIVLGSFLLFLVQPMVGNVVLPVLGGTAGVWIVCLCAFQTLLVLGYLYAHVLGELVDVGSRLKWMHIALMIVAAGMLFFSDSLFSVLSATAVLYVAVGANASLVQRLVASDRGAYRLYALSNLGSFAGLLAYPLGIEIFLPTSVQVKCYSGCVVGYATLLALLMIVLRAREGKKEKLKPSFAVLSGISVGEAVPWFVLSAISCLVLDGLTSHLCHEIAPLPLLWCVLLAIYLLAWTLAFNDRGSRIGKCLGPLIFACVAVEVVHDGSAAGMNYVIELLVGAVLLLAGCWYVHSHLYARRPEVGKLTGYYFVIAIGGAAGGLLATLVAPLAFDFMAEYPLAQIALLGLLVGNGLVWVRSLKVVVEGRSAAAEFIRSSNMSLAVWALFAVAACGTWKQSDCSVGPVLAQARNLYGTTSVIDWPIEGEVSSRVRIDGTSDDRPSPTFITMRNNGTRHGMQYAVGRWRRYAPTLYYSEVGGGMAVLNHPAYLQNRPMRVALLGMGVGTMAYYGREGDVYRFFEIDPNVIRMATNPDYFTFLSKCSAKVEISEGDARKQLEKEQEENAFPYDLLVVDVFSGDSVPSHLMTVEAMSLYKRRLKGDGVIALHITNWHIDLLPIVKALAKSAGLRMRVISSVSREDGTSSCWAYLSHEPLSFELKVDEQKEVDVGSVEDCPVPTDDHHSLLPHIKMAPESQYRFLP